MFDTSIFHINFTHKYLRRFCALYIILFCPVFCVPALEADECGDEPLSSLAGSEQIMETGPLRGHMFWLPEKLKYSAAFDTTANLSGGGYNWEGPPPESPDWGGIKLDTTYFIVLQFAAIFVLYVAPEALSGWSEEDKENYSLSRWKENVKNPIWDDDRWWVNYILHPYWNATYYIRGRERGLKRLHSFFYTFFLSALYEFGAEALFEPVSYQDLLITPIPGALLGEYLFSPLRKRIRTKDQLDWPDKAMLFITDPLGVVSEELSHFFGVNTRVSLTQLIMQNITPLSGVGGETEIFLPASDPSKPVWGLRMKLSW